MDDLERRGRLEQHRIIRDASDPATVDKALRELADGHFHDGVGNKFPLTLLGRCYREAVIAAALRNSRAKGD